MKHLILLLGIFFSSSNFSQFGYLNKYIPYDSLSYTTHPLVEIKIWVHVIQKNNNNPENYTKKSVDKIQQHFTWINEIYSSLSRPTLTNSQGRKPFIKDSRIRFNLDTITFHVNENDWDRLRFSPEENKKKHLQIININPDSNTVLIKGIKNRYNPIKDSIIIRNTRFNNGFFHVKKLNKVGTNTLIYLEEEIFVSEDTIGYLTYFIKNDKNCSDDNWVKYTNKNEDYIHVFYTGSSNKSPAFGCGPSPFYLNISNAIHNGEFATAQLISHEIGHCMGLRHTDSPQFNDLPKTDRFGWVECNKINTSNNIMGYNKCRRYLSPLQIGYIHYRYANNSKLYSSVSINNDNENTYITENTIWNKSIHSKNNIIVKKNTTLKIKNKLIMSDNTSIILEKKSKLIVDGGKILFGGSSWKGIIKCKSEFNQNKRPSKSKNMPKIEILNKGEINY
tara:strand:+ start:14842 stop:16185 length:1344 start_codon:yes stop_codon:yes gene_type:complete